MRRRKRNAISEEQSGTNFINTILQKTGLNTLLIGFLSMHLLTTGILCLSIKFIFDTEINNLQTKIQSDIYRDVKKIDELISAEYDPNDKTSQAQDIKNSVNEMFENQITDVVILQNSQTKDYRKLSYTTPEGVKDNLEILRKDKKQDLRNYKILKFPDERESEFNYKTTAITKGNKTVCLITKNAKNIAGHEKFDNLLNLILLIGLILSLFGSITFSLFIRDPITQLKKAFIKVSEGDFDAKTYFFSFNEFNEIQSGYNRMLDAMQALYSSLENEVANRTKDLKNANLELKNTQAMMIHSEKMKSLGELVAGIMHEINNPINFIYGNMIHLNNYSADLINIIDEYGKHEAAMSPETKEIMENLKNEVDYEFLKTDLPDLIKSCKEGADRAKNIIQDLKSFSRMEEVSVHKVDLSHELDLTLNILHNKIKNKAKIHKEIEPDLPEVEAYGGQLNQVFMNILDNATGAIPEHGDVWIRMKPDKTGKRILIEIEDNGEGMEEETMRKIFNPFFTTKPVGKGTGLGLSITYKIIKSHQGNISVKSKKGEGTKFTISLPLKINLEAKKEESGAVNG